MLLQRTRFRHARPCSFRFIPDAFSSSSTHPHQVWFVLPKDYHIQKYLVQPFFLLFLEVPDYALTWYAACGLSECKPDPSHFIFFTFDPIWSYPSNAICLQGSLIPGELQYKTFSKFVYISASRLALRTLWLLERFA